MRMKQSRSGHGEFVTLVLEQMAGFGVPRVRRMFGGHGLYHDDLMFAIILKEKLYLKADAVNVGRFENAGLQPFTYASKGKQVSLRYYEAPPDVYEDQEEMLQWARSAFEAALRARK